MAADVSLSPPSRTPRPPRHPLLRVAQNVYRLPQRTVRSLARFFTPDYRLERRALAHVRRHIPADRRELLEGVPGMSSARECALLAFLAHTAPGDGWIVEIGAWKGKSAAWLVEGSQLRRKPLPVVSIDPHERDSWNEFQATASRLDLTGRGLEVRRAFSHEIGRAWRRPIALLWVDGCHEYEPVRQDIADFAPHVVADGWVVFDDAAGGRFPGVERALAERMDRDPRFRRVATLRHLAVYRRAEAA